MPLFRRFVAPMVHYSKGSLVRRFVNPNLGAHFQVNISTADSTQARHLQILGNMGIAEFIVIVIVIVTIEHVISIPTSTSGNGRTSSKYLT